MNTPSNPHLTPAPAAVDNSVGGVTGPSFTNVQLNYVLYIIAIMNGLTAIVGVVFAYTNRGKANETLQSHYTYLIRTFWIAFLGGLVSMLLMIVLIGFATGFLVTVWFVVRAIRGLTLAAKGQPIPNPKTWWI